MIEPRIVSIDTANPPERFTQEEVLALSPYKDPLRRGFFLHSGIETRHLAIDRQGFQANESLDQLSARYETSAIDMACRALRGSLERAGRSLADIDFLATASCTGRLCPHLDARLIQVLGLRSGIQRVHVGDTGCHAAVVALQQAFNHLQAFPDHLAAVVAVEVSSASYFIDDDPQTAVGNAIFGDGAGALLLAAEGPGPAVVGHGTFFRPEFMDLVGFTFPQGRQRILLSKDIPAVASEMIGELTTRLLEAHRISRSQVRHWALHAAGRRVLEQTQERMGLSPADMEPARRVLARFGNMSSATVLFVLRDLLETAAARAGDFGLLVALGPGFAAEGALLRW